MQEDHARLTNRSCSHLLLVQVNHLNESPGDVRAATYAKIVWEQYLLVFREYSHRLYGLCRPESAIASQQQNLRATSIEVYSKLYQLHTHFPRKWTNGEWRLTYTNSDLENNEHIDHAPSRQVMLVLMPYSSIKPRPSAREWLSITISVRASGS